MVIKFGLMMILYMVTLNSEPHIVLEEQQKGATQIVFQQTPTVSSEAVIMSTEEVVDEAMLGEKKESESQVAIKKDEKIETSLQSVLQEIDGWLENTSQIQILDLQYEYPTLTLDLSKEIISYGGGNTIEYEIISKLLTWGFEVTDCESMQISIEKELTRFPEGSMTTPCTRESYEKYYKVEEVNEAKGEMD